MTSIQPGAEQNWHVQDRFLEFRSPWVTLIGEHLQDDRQQILDYWRVERVDSVVVLPIQSNRILLHKPSYRPGVGHMTLDLPGGRVAEQSPAAAAIAALERELGVAATAVIQLMPLNRDAWVVNSSFSNQKLHSFVAQIEPNLKSDLIDSTYPATLEGLQLLLQEITCLQCRAVLLEWWLQTSAQSK